MNFKWSKNKTLILFALLFFSGFLIHNVINKPFPFFKVTYINNKNVFNADPFNYSDFYDLKFAEFVKLLPQNKLEIEKLKKATTLEKIIYATELTREIQEKSLGNQIKNYNNILSDDSAFQEICSESSKIFLYLMHTLGERVRVLWLNGHTITEVWDKNDWIFVDTSSNALAFDKDNEKFSSFLNILKSTSSIEFKPIIETKHKLWDYRDSPTRLHEIIDENNLIVVLSNKNIFDFHTIEEKINRVLNSIFLSSNYEAIQFLHDSKTPKVGNIGINLYKRILN
tara:strand:- start:50 stop:898 length:849 start_codon:yes stop_codon:yes gene_type:complete